MMDASEAIPREEYEAVPQSGRLGRVIDRLAIIPALGLVVAMLILIQEVVLRYVFGRPTNWAHETTVFLCAISFVYGGLLCTARDRHIRVVLVYDLLPPAARRVADILISAIYQISGVSGGRADYGLASALSIVVFVVIGVVSAAASGGGRELVPRDQAVAFPVSPTTDHLGALLMAPLNIA